MKVVLDTNILVRAVISPAGPAAELLTRIAADHLLVASLAILSELYEVLKRPPKLREVSIIRVKNS